MAEVIKEATTKVEWKGETQTSESRPEQSAVAYCEENYPWGADKAGLLLTKGETRVRDG